MALTLDCTFTIKHRVAALMLFAWLLLLPLAASGDEILMVADEWCPYNCAAGADAPGYMVELARYAFETQGHSVSYKVVPWPRAIEGTRSGAYDVIIGAGKEEVPDFIFPDETAGLAVHSFYVTRTSDWTYTGLDALHEMTLGVIKDYSYGTLFNDYIKPNEGDPKRLSIVSGDNALPRIIRMLMHGRIDAMIEDKNVMDYQFMTRADQHLIRAAGVACEEQLFIAFSPANKESAQYTRLLDNAIREMKASGALTTLLNKYGIKSW